MTSLEAGPQTAKKEKSGEGGKNGAEKGGPRGQRENYADGGGRSVDHHLRISGKGGTLKVFWGREGG